MNSRRMHWPVVSCMVLTLLGTGCAKDPVTIAMHDPIYPAAGSAVTYTLEAVSGSKPSKVDLYETISIIDGTGAITSTGSASKLQSWRSPGGRIEFTMTGGYDANSLVRYRFVVKARSGLWPHKETYDQEVVFATRPDPNEEAQRSTDVNALPAPVYAVGDPGASFNIVFIPDKDISPGDMDAFRGNCRDMIREAFLNEPTIQLFRRSFNFYINPSPGEAVPWTNSPNQQRHVPPVNFAQLDFASGCVLMHKRLMQDWAEYGMGNIYSTEMNSPATIRHESGHTLFLLGDEYAGGSHKKADPLPNNWPSPTEAQAEARSRGKAGRDVQPMDGAWCKLCVQTCPMNVPRRKPYDRPCHDRVVWCVRDNASRNATP